VNHLYDATVLDPSLWISIWLVERSVCFWPSWLSRLTSSSSGHVLFSTRVLWSAAFVPVVGASCFPNLFSKVSSSSLLQFIFENSVTILSILREPYFLNWYKFLVSALSSLLNGMLHYQYIVIALKILCTMTWTVTKWRDFF